MEGAAIKTAAARVGTRRASRSSLLAATVALLVEADQCIPDGLTATRNGEACHDKNCRTAGSPKFNLCSKTIASARTVLGVFLSCFRKRTVSARTGIAVCTSSNVEFEAVQASCGSPEHSNF